MIMFWFDVFSMDAKMLLEASLYFSEGLKYTVNVKGSTDNEATQ